MTFHVYLVDPHDGKAFDTPIENGVTHRPASWSTLESAQRYVDDCTATRRWNASRDDFAYGYLIKPHKED